MVKLVVKLEHNSFWSVNTYEELISSSNCHRVHHTDENKIWLEIKLYGCPNQKILVDLKMTYWSIDYKKTDSKRHMYTHFKL